MQLFYFDLSIIKIMHQFVSKDRQYRLLGELHNAISEYLNSLFESLDSILNTKNMNYYIREL